MGHKPCFRPAIAAALLVSIAAAGLAPDARADPAPPVIDPSLGRVEVLLDLPKDVPYVGEMILLRMRTTIRGFVALDSLRQPPLTNFNWQQLGRDKPIRVMADGFDVPGYERDIAIFPQQAGRLIIEPFVRHVTMVVGINERVETDFASKPVYVDVQRHEGISAGGWWLPAKAVTIKETWEPPPSAIEPGKVARRIVTIEAIGTTADRLPPPPVMRAPGIIAFAGPVIRETVLTPDGPVARASYQWDLRPATGAPAKLPAIHVAWFDMGERRMRDSALPDHWVGHLDGGVPGGSTPRTLGSVAALATAGPLTAGIGAFLWAAAVAGLFASARQRRDWRWTLRPTQLRALKRSAKRRDVAEVKAALMALARTDPHRWAVVAGLPEVAAALARLDAALYAKGGGEAPPLDPLAVAIERAWKAAEPRRRVVADSLLPLDG